MYTWEKPFNILVAKIREQEIKQVRFAAYIRGINFRLYFYYYYLVYFF